MTINHVLPSQVRASGIQRPKGEGNAKGKDDSDSVASGGRSDRVEISPEGRILSTQAQSSPDEVEDLSQEQVEAARRLTFDIMGGLVMETVMRTDSPSFDQPLELLQENLLRLLREPRKPE